MKRDEKLLTRREAIKRAAMAGAAALAAPMINRSEEPCRGYMSVDDHKAIPPTP